MDCTQQNNGHCKHEVGRGCTFCNCSTDAEATLCDGCFKLHETPWMEEYPDNSPTNIFEVRFKNTRRGFYLNVNDLPLQRGDVVAVEASPGHDIGIISLTGDLVAKQMRRTGFNPQNGEFKKIYRKAKPYDIERWQESIALEHETMILARQIAADMNLNMKIGDVEYQGDKIKAIFYYIADERVDFRELIKVFAERFHIRIEMKQIGARQEAGRIGGLGACGRELCCASWMSGFSSVTTGAARMQDISLNPQKLAGQCSKLKCCLMYEYDTYVDARREFPRLREPLQTLDGEFFLVKSDVLADTLTFSSSKDSMSNLVTLTAARVREIVALNRAGKKVDRLRLDEAVDNAPEEPTYRSEEDSITRFDQAKRRGKGRGKGGKPESAGTEGEASQEVETRTGEGSNRTSNRRPASRANRPSDGERRNATPQRDANKEGNRNRGNRQPNQQGGPANSGEKRNGENRNGENRNSEKRNGENRNSENRSEGARNQNNNNRRDADQQAAPQDGERRSRNRGGRNRGRGRGNGGGGNSTPSESSGSSNTATKPTE